MNDKNDKEYYPVLPGAMPFPGTYGSPIGVTNKFGDLNDEDQITEGSLSEDEMMEIRQRSAYNEFDKATPDNNMFFEGRSNPLSSKGN